MKRQKTKKTESSLVQILKKYADENKENFTAVKEGMKLYDDYLKQAGVKANKEKIITAEGYNVFSRS